MKLFLDTHTFLWFIGDNPRLSDRGRCLLEEDNDLLLSTASLWEIAIKYSLGRLVIPSPYEAFVTEQLKINEIEILPIAHLAIVTSLPFHHRDPFDRLLIAQSIVENTPLVSKDSVFGDYSVECLW